MHATPHVSGLLTESWPELPHRKHQAAKITATEESQSACDFKPLGFRSSRFVSFLLCKSRDVCQRVSRFHPRRSPPPPAPPARAMPTRSRSKAIRLPPTSCRTQPPRPPDTSPSSPVCIPLVREAGQQLRKNIREQVFFFFDSLP